MEKSHLLFIKKICYFSTVSAYTFLDMWGILYFIIISECHLRYFSHDKFD